MDDYDYLGDVVKHLQEAIHLIENMNDEYIQDDLTSEVATLEDFIIDIRLIMNNIQENDGEYVR